MHKIGCNTDVVFIHWDVKYGMEVNVFLELFWFGN